MSACTKVFDFGVPLMCQQLEATSLLLLLRLLRGLSRMAGQILTA